MMYSARITGTGSAFPETVVSNEELTRRLAMLNVETSNSWIHERTGIRERRYSDLSRKDEYNSSLAASAAAAALEMAGKKPGDIDQILVGTCTPETLIPSTACWVQQKLGARNAWAMDLNSACTGFLFGLVTAHQFIRSGETRTALVIGSEVLHPYLNWRDRTSCILFGDAAGAAIVESVPDDQDRRILSWYVHSDGRLAELLCIRAYHPEEPLSPDGEMKMAGKIVMNGREIFKAAVRTLSDCARHVLGKCGMTIDDIDWFVPHQANLRILEAVANRMGIPMEKVLVNVDRFANSSAATVPTILDEAVRDGRIQKGQTILLDAFGAGLTCGAVLIKW
jgi:3-oxoacyl-[acyl-carrier-protein] synthase-3